MPINAQIEQLRSFCDRDTQQSLPNMAEMTGLSSEEAALDFIMSVPPAIVIPVERLIEFTGTNPGALNLQRTLSKDKRIAQAPLNKSWMPIRLGRIGSEGLPQIHADLQVYARPYARAVMRHFELIREEGYLDFTDALEQNGYGMNSIIKALNVIRQERGRLGLDQVKSAADIRKVYRGEAVGALLGPDQVYKYITEYFPEGLTEVVYEPYPPNRATSSIFANLNVNGDAEVRFILVHGPEMAANTRTHEYSHVYFAIQRAHEGRIPTLLLPLGPTEVFAKGMGGVEPGETVFFATCMEAAYDFVLNADDILSSAALSRRAKIGRLSGLIANPRRKLTTVSGFTPVESSTVVPFGAFSVPYFFDVVKALPFRSQVERMGLTDPKEIYKLVA